MNAHRICPRHKTVVVEPSPVELVAELVPMERGPAIRTVARYLGGFESRIPPLTQEELRSMDRVRRAAATHSEAS